MHYRLRLEARTWITVRRKEESKIFYRYLIETPGLPIRLQRLSALPWYDCWVQQLRIEKKSKHTIRAYTLSAKTFSQTSLPGEDERCWDDLSQISVSEFHQRANPDRGRMDAWMNTLGA